jgi:hypothetical protein
MSNQTLLCKDCEELWRIWQEAVNCHSKTCALQSDGVQGRSGAVEAPLYCDCKEQRGPRAGAIYDGWTKLGDARIVRTGPQTPRAAAGKCSMCSFIWFAADRDGKTVGTLRSNVRSQHRDPLVANGKRRLEGYIDFQPSPHRSSLTIDGHGRSYFIISELHQEQVLNLGAANQLAEGRSATVAAVQGMYRYDLA